MLSVIQMLGRKVLLRLPKCEMPHMVTWEGAAPFTKDYVVKPCQCNHISGTQDRKERLKPLGEDWSQDHNILGQVSPPPCLQQCPWHSHLVSLNPQKPWLPSVQDCIQLAISSTPGKRESNSTFPLSLQSGIKISSPACANTAQALGWQDLVSLQPNTSQAQRIRKVRASPPQNVDPKFSRKAKLSTKAHAQ